MSGDFMQSLSDAGSSIGSSIGDFASGAGNAFSNVAGTIGDALSGVGQAFAGGASAGGSAGGGSAPAIANATDAADNLIDPATTAQTAIQGPQPAPTQTQSQNPQGPQGGQGGQGEGSFAPQSAIDALRKEIARLRSQPNRNPYQAGGDTQRRDPQISQSDEGPAGGEPTPRPPWWKWAGGLPFQPKETSDPNEVTDIPGTFKKGQGFVQDPDPRAGPAGEAAVDQALTRQAGESAVEQALQRPPPGGTPGTVPGAGGAGTMPSGGPNLSGLAGMVLPRVLEAPLGAVGTYFGSTTPAETGELPYGGYKGDTSSFAPPKQDDYRPEDDPSFEKPRGAPGRADSPIDPRTGKPFEKPGTTVAPKTGKKVQTVDPKTKKPVDPQTGDPLPTKKGHYEPTPGNIRQPEWVPESRNPIMRDVAGGQGVPPMLGQLAQMAMPLILGALMSGGFGGRRGPGMVGRRWGHPGGFGGRNFGFGRGQYWPYHHPSYGWGLHGQYPGQGWLPMDPRHMRGLLGGGLGGNALPFTGGGNQTDGGPAAADEPSYNPYYDKGSRYRNPGTPSATVIGKGPDGQALPYTGEEVADFTHDVAEGLGMDSGVAQQILAGESSYGQNYTNNRERDRIPSYGPFQLHDSGPGSVGYAFRTQTGEDARDPSTWKDQVVFALRWAQKNGWSPWGAATDHGIPQWAGIDRKSNKQFAWNYGKENGGVTQTGGSMDPVQVGTAGGQPVMSNAQ